MPKSEDAGVDATVVSGWVTCCAIAAREDIHHDIINHAKRVEFIGFFRDDVQELREGSPQEIYGSPWERASRETHMGDIWCSERARPVVQKAEMPYHADAPSSSLLLFSMQLTLMDQSRFR